MYPAILMCVFAASPIVDSDWKSRDGSFLAFRPAKKDEEGVVWYVRPDSGVAFRGWYQLDPGHGDYPRLWLSFVQKWKRVRGSGWWFDYSYMKNPYGVATEAIADKRSLVVTVTGLFEADHRTGALKKADIPYPSHLMEGQVLEMAPDTLPDDGLSSLWGRQSWKSNAKKEPGMIFNTSFVGADLMGGLRDTNAKLVGEAVLSLRRTKQSWQEGGVWFIGRFGEAISAGRGTFAIEFIGSLDEAVLKLTIGRVYQGDMVGGRITGWKSISEERGSSHLRPGGVDFVIPMYDRGFLLSDADMYVDDLSFVDSEGKRMNRYYSTGPFGLFSEKYDQESVGVLRRGWIFNCSVRGKKTEATRLTSLLEATPPPGFRLKDAE